MSKTSIKRGQAGCQSMYFDYCKGVLLLVSALHSSHTQDKVLEGESVIAAVYAATKAAFIPSNSGQTSPTPTKDRTQLTAVAHTSQTIVTSIHLPSCSLYLLSLFFTHLTPVCDASLIADRAAIVTTSRFSQTLSTLRPISYCFAHTHADSPPRSLIVHPSPHRAVCH